MTTCKGNVTEQTIMGSLFLFMAILTGLLDYFKKGMDVGLIMSAMFGALGLGVIGSTRIALPSWADRRAAQWRRSPSGFRGCWMSRAGTREGNAYFLRPRRTDTHATRKRTAINTFTTTNDAMTFSR